MGAAFTLVAGIVLLGALVFFHELGHFLAAKAFRVKVLKFSLGFGPRVWGFRRGETEYQLAALPLGGFVRMAGEDPTAEVAPEDRGRGFNEQPPWKRGVIALAGPAVNLLLPPIVFFLMFLTPQPKEPAYVGWVLPDEPAERAGLRAGDRVVQIDGEPIRSFEEMKEQIEQRAGVPLKLVVERGGERLELGVTPTGETETNPIETTRKGKIGIVNGKMPAYVGVVPGSRAETAGLRTFDRITKVNDTPVTTSLELENALKTAGSGPVAFEVVRGVVLDQPTAPIGTATTLVVAVPAGEGPLGLDQADLYVRDVTADSNAAKAGLQPLDRIVAVAGRPVLSGPRLERILDGRFRENLATLPLTVQRGAERVELSFEVPVREREDRLLGPVREPDFGFAFHPGLYLAEPFRPDELVQVSYSPGQAIVRGVEQTLMITRGMVLGIAGLFTGRVSTKTIGGPIMLFQLAGASAQHGLAEFLRVFVLISINLGIVNLLPIPALDGFHILVSTVEGISRRPVPVKFREYAQVAGVVLLLLLMVFAIKNDIVRTLAQ